jgi:hypothetical protein
VDAVVLLTRCHHGIVVTLAVDMGRLYQHLSRAELDAEQTLFAAFRYNEHTSTGKALPRQVEEPQALSHVITTMTAARLSNYTSPPRIRQ